MDKCRFDGESDCKPKDCFLSGTGARATFWLMEHVHPERSLKPDDKLTIGFGKVLTDIVDCARQKILPKQ